MYNFIICFYFYYLFILPYIYQNKYKYLVEYVEKLIFWL